MSKIKSEFRPADEIRSVSVKEQQVFDTGKTVYTVHVTRNTVTIDNLIEAICQKRPDYRHYMLKQFAADLQDEILANLASGNAVDLLDLGCLYLAAGALKNRPADVNDIGELTVKFTASSMTCQAVKDITIDKMVVADSSPVISVVECLGAKDEGTLEAGKVVRLSGARLKLGAKAASSPSRRWMSRARPSLTSRSGSKWMACSSSATSPRRWNSTCPVPFCPMPTTA